MAYQIYKYSVAELQKNKNVNINDSKASEIR